MTGLKRILYPLDSRPLTRLLLCFVFSAAIASPSSGEPVHKTSDAEEPLPRGALHRYGSTCLQHGDQILDLSLEASGRHVASISRDHTARIWDVQTGREILRQPVQWGRSVAMATLGKNLILATGTESGVIRCWSTSSRKKPFPVLSGHKSPIERLAFSANGIYLASLDQDRNMRVWRAQTGQLIISLKSPDAVAIALSPNGNHLVLGAKDGRVRIYQADTGEIQKQWKADNQPIQSIHVSADSTTLWTLSPSKIQQWQQKPTKKVTERALPETQSSVRRIGEKGVVASASTNNYIVMSTFGDHRYRALHSGSPGTVEALLCASDGSQVISYAAGQVVVVAKGKAQLQIKTKGPAQIALSPSEARLAIGPPEGPVRILSFPNGKEQTSLSNPRGMQVRAMAFSPVEGELAIAYADPETEQQVVRLWQPEPSHQVRAFRCPAPLTSIAYAPGGKVLAGAGQDQVLYRWNTKTGELLENWTGKLSTDAKIAFSPNGEWLASTNREGMITLSHATTGEVKAHITGHPGRCSALAFSPDSRALASGGAWDAIVLLTEVTTGQVVRRFQGHTGSVTALAFAPGGRELITGSRDATLLTWDLPGFRTGLNQKPKDLSYADQNWDELGCNDAEKAYLAVWALSSDSAVSVPFLKDKLRRWMGVSAQRVEAWIQKLDARRYLQREKAAKELRGCLHLAAPALRRALAHSQSLEVKRRIRKLLAQAVKPEELEQEQLRAQRALNALEKMIAQSPDQPAIQLLDAMAQNSSDVLLQGEARAILSRLPGSQQHQAAKPALDPKEK